MTAVGAWVAGPQHHRGEQHQDAEQVRAERETLRLAGRGTAMARAAGWSMPFAVVMLVSAYVVAGIARSHYIGSAVGTSAYSTDPHPPPPYLLWLLLPGAVCWAACALAEVLLARTLAGDYPLLGPWAWIPESTLPRTARRAVGGIDRKLGNVGGGCLGVAALAIAGPLVVIGWSVFTAAAVALWVLAVLGVTLVHLLTVRSRLGAWHRRGRVDAGG
jgi:hypothetical protein